MIIFRSVRFPPKSGSIHNGKPLWFRWITLHVLQVKLKMKVFNVNYESLSLILSLGMFFFRQWLTAGFAGVLRYSTFFEKAFPCSTCVSAFVAVAALGKNSMRKIFFLDYLSTMSPRLKMSLTHSPS